MHIPLVFIFFRVHSSSSKLSSLISLNLPFLLPLPPFPTLYREEEASDETCLGLSPPRRLPLLLFLFLLL